MTDNPIDFSSIDPTRDRVRFEQVVDAIRSAAEPQLARRRIPVMAQIGSWWRPMLAAAAVVAAVSLGALWQTPESSVSPEPAAAFAESLGLSTNLAQLVDADETPGVSQLLAVEEFTR